jgi:protein-tyrosine phosphatase
MLRMRMQWVAVGITILCTTTAGWGDSASPDVAAGTGLQHFTQIDTQILAGSKPKSDADYEFLRAKGVKYIVQANFLPGRNGAERAKAAKFGMEYRSVPMNASFVAPQEKHVNEILRLMRTRQPVYIHCVLGRDRTSLLAGLYKMYFQGLSKDQAYKLMKEEGFRDVFFLHGLKTYFDKHTHVPAELADLARGR